ncbi:hypothetical protein ACFY4H_25645 [Streptomyces althioticus]|uniref:hypothetical protein n=1 Tax=Streptomyces althioticus TaxID=83380 RepID=UPI0036C9F826
MSINTGNIAETSGCPVAWLVGLPFRTAAARTVRFYYVVAAADNDKQAVWLALERANGDRYWATHHEQLSPGTTIEVQRVLRDLLGNTSLTRCTDFDGQHVPDLKQVIQ